jgi:hypothetical protein
LRERTLRQLTQKICEKLGVETSRISRILKTNGHQPGFEVLVDDDFVQQMTDCQAMTVKIENLSPKGENADSTACASSEIKLEYSS